MIDLAVRKPVSVAVAAILIVMFGMLAAFELPVQLTPDVDRPIITVRTLWEGASPQEVEREIIDEQEDKLSSIPGLFKMSSAATEGSGTVTLEFLVGVDTDRALLDVNEKLQQVPRYPADADRPVTSAGETQGANAIAWFILRRTENSPLLDEDLPLLRTLIEEEVKPRLKRADGIADVGIFGGVEREIQVQVDPYKLAARHLTMVDLRDAIRGHNVDVSAGDLDHGKRAVKVRTVGKFDSLDQIEDLVLARRNGQLVYLREVATVVSSFKETTTIVRSMGQRAIAVNAQKQSGRNVIRVMSALEAAVTDVNEHLLADKGLHLTQVYDQTDYIFSAIDLVVQNLWVGGLLAIAVLLVFLRSWSSTLIVAIAIPISVIGSFLGLAMLGRNLNVISLAGLAFAVGMVVDNSIVVLENIYRHRQLGKRPFEAALIGTREVFGAVIASTLTTLAVFVPVVFVQEEAGQLFRDIAIAISASVFLSLIVSVLFIPTAAARLMRGQAKLSETSGDGSWLGGPISRIVARLNQRVSTRVATVVGLTGAALLLSWWFLPPTTYLPAGNQNLVIGFVIPPPGLNIPEYERMAEKIEGRLAPYWSVTSSSELTPELRRPAWYQGPGEIPVLDNFFYVAFGNAVFMGARSRDETNVKPIEALISYAGAEVPGVFVVAQQRSLFQSGLGASNSIDLEISGFDLGDINTAALALQGRLRQSYGYSRAEPSNFNLGASEYRVKIDSSRAAELGLSVRDLGFIVQTVVDGAIASDYRDRGAELDIKILPAGYRKDLRNQLEQVPIHTPSGRLVPLSALASVQDTTSPSEIRHIEERRAVKLIVTPPPTMELSLAMEDIQDKIIPELRKGGQVPGSVTTALAGTASKLTSTRQSLQMNFLLALIITYLLLSALFESFLYPFVILFSVPLAAVGGVLGLSIVHAFTGQQLDVLTMLGFVILIGTVVNNAILIVHQALNYIRAGTHSDDDAIVEAVRTRVRPIFMSTSTSVLGMLPLVLFPGAGSELYKGLGSVVVGGLVASTIFTLFVVPTLFSLVMSASRRMGSRVASAAELEEAVAR